MMIAAALDKFALDAQAALAVDGASAELGVTGHFDAFLHAILPQITTTPLVIVPQAAADATGIPDFRVNGHGELVGWIEFKAVVGKDLDKLAGHDKLQRERFTAGLQNVIFTTGWQWELWQDGKKVKRVTLDPAMFTTAPVLPPEPRTMDALHDLLDAFLNSTPGPYSKPEAAVTALARRAKALKMGLIALGQDQTGPVLAQLHTDFKALLYRNGQPFTWERFVDAYVQIASFGALLWRLESKAPIGLDQQVALKQQLHPLLSQCLSILWSPQSRHPILEPLLDGLCRTANLIEPDLFIPSLSTRGHLRDPLVHAYEPFFAAYDAAARESNGVYYTPIEVVQQIVSGIDDLLRHTLGRPDGILDDNARFLDPATGTGTFLLGLANEVAHEAESVGLPTDQVVHEVLTKRTSAFELFPGPYTIAHQRLEALLANHGTPATDRLPIYLADTLAAPETGQLPVSGFGAIGAEIAAERAKADWVKTGEELLVVLGNPPWERMKANAPWDTFAKHLLGQVTEATPVERRADLKSASDLFVAFWAWALWALRTPDQRATTAAVPVIDTPTNHGLVAFVTNRTWIIGPSLIGLRALVRKGVREVWVYDLGGDSRGSAGAQDFAEGGDANVFGIQTGAAIVWLAFDRSFTGDPEIHYKRTTGTKRVKLDALAEPFDRTSFTTITDPDVFVPVEWPPALATAPSLFSLFVRDPFTGIQSARDKRPHAPWGTEPDAVYQVTRRPNAAPALHGALGDWAQLAPTKRYEAWATADAKRRKRPGPDPASLSTERVRPALYRAFDERFVYDDPAWIDWYREDLHEVYADGPVPTLVTLPRDFGSGPLALHTTLLPEQHAFKGRGGGRGVLPLWRPTPEPDDGLTVIGGRRTLLAGPSLAWARSTFASNGWQMWEDTYNYLLGILTAPIYARELWVTLEAEAARIPLTSDAELATAIAEIGAAARRAWEKDVRPTGITWGGNAASPQVGQATWASDTITFANGRTIAGVTEDMWRFTISGHRVLPSWFAARTHWVANMSQALQTQKTLAAVRELLTTMRLADALFLKLTHPSR